MSTCLYFVCYMFELSLFTQFLHWQPQARWLGQGLSEFNSCLDMRVWALGEKKVWMWFCSYILKSSLVEKNGSFNES